MILGENWHPTEIYLIGRGIRFQSNTACLLLAQEHRRQTRRATLLSADDKRLPGLGRCLILLSETKKARQKAGFMGVNQHRAGTLPQAHFKQLNLQGKQALCKVPYRRRSVPRH